VAYAAGFHANQDFSISGLRIRCALNGEWLFEFVKYRSLHYSNAPSYTGRSPSSWMAAGIGVYPNRTNVHSMNKRSVF
jgi:hypothetical protein